MVSGMTGPRIPPSTHLRFPPIEPGRSPGPGPIMGSVPVEPAHPPELRSPRLQFASHPARQTCAPVLAWSHTTNNLLRLLLLRAAELPALPQLRPGSRFPIACRRWFSATHQRLLVPKQGWLRSSPDPHEDIRRSDRDPSLCLRTLLFLPRRSLLAFAQFPRPLP